ncbi:hypothetical protein ACSFA8_04850 [Variovorax sp. RT4R15]|uniref:hypothetical protein n=1 Tax=Variovorax sp. RT4R15 TaxID=3443737 RepID=UPI003F461178
MARKARAFHNNEGSDMKWFVMAVGTVALASSLVGCGGGGGGSGGGFLPIAPVAPTTPAAPLTVSVSVNGAAATADANGQYSVKAGDTIAITPSQAAEWTTSPAASAASAITPISADVSSAKWSAQLINTTTAASTYTVSAKATSNSALTKDTVLNVAGGDARNGTYKVFATNGTKQTLAINFDTMSYTMTDSAGVAISDAIKADPTRAGSYLFASARNIAVTNNARFRVTTDAIVGSFPFALSSSPSNFGVQAFVAARTFITTQAQLDGTFTRLGINLTATTRDSNIRQAKITGGGTVFLLCNEVAITAVDSCPTVSLLTYNVTPGASSDLWRIENVIDPSDTGSFSIAQIGGQPAYFAAGPVANTPTMNVFRIGLAASATWAITASTGGDTSGTWGSVNFDATTYGSTVTRGDGTIGSLAYPLNFSTLPPGLAGINFAGPDRYFGAQNGVLSAVVGARTGPVAGYMQIGLVD